MDLVFERPLLLAHLFTTVGCGCCGSLASVSRAFRAVWESSTLTDDTIGILLVLDRLSVANGYCVDSDFFSGGWGSPIAIYDLKSGKIQDVAPRWQRSRMFAAACVDLSVYIFGGYTDHETEFCYSAEATNRVWNCDLATQVWTQQTPMPTARAAAVAVALDGFVYVLGGCQRRVDNEGVELSDDELVGTGEWSTEEEALATAEKFSLETHEWDQVPLMLTPRLAFTAVALKTSIFVFGGKGHSPLLETMDFFNVDTLQWSFCSFRLSPRHLSAAVGVGDSIYVFGGDEDPTYNISSTRITVENGTVSLLPVIPTQTHFGAALHIDDSIYVLGSNNSSTSGDPAAVCKFDLLKNVWSQLPSMHTQIGRCCAAAQIYLPIRKHHGNLAAEEASQDVDEAVPVTETVEHTEDAAEIRAQEAQEIVAEQHAGGIERLLFTGSVPTEVNGEDEEAHTERIFMCMLNRRPKGIAEALSLTLKPQIEAMAAKGYPWKLLEGSFIFVHHHQYVSTKRALVGHALHPSNIIFSESLEYLVAEALDSIGKGAWAKCSELIGVLPGPLAETCDSVLIGSELTEVAAENDAGADDDADDGRKWQLKLDSPNTEPDDAQCSSGADIKAEAGAKNEDDHNVHPVLMVKRTFLTFAEAPRAAASVAQSTTDASSSKGLNPRRKAPGSLGQ